MDKTTVNSKIILLTLVCMFLLPAFHENKLMAQDVTKSGTSAATFLRIPVGSRGTALGGAFVATVDDPSAMYWNPGGIPLIQNYALMIDHSPWLPGLSFNFIGLVIPMGSAGVIGFNVTSLSTSKMDITTPLSPMGTGETFDAAFTAVGFTYGRKLTESFSIGATAKYINERIYNSNATGFAFDVGTIYDTPLPGLRLGFSITNVGGKMSMMGEDLNVRIDPDPANNGNNNSIVGQYKTDEFDLPLLMRVGLSWDAFHSAGNRLTFAVEGLNPIDNSQSMNTGAEFAFYNELFIIRAGYNELFLEDTQKGLTLGAGFNIAVANDLYLKADYGFQAFEYLGNVNRFTFTIAF